MFWRNYNILIIFFFIYLIWQMNKKNVFFNLKDFINIYIIILFMYLKLN